MKFSQINSIGRHPRFGRDVVLLFLGTLLLLALVFPFSSSRVEAQAPLPLTLVSDSRDVNGFDFNPRWAWQNTNPGTPDPNVLCFNGAGQFGGCTSDALYFDEPEPYKIHRQTCRITAGTAVKGHINWRAVTYEAPITWSGFSIDGDYCLELAPQNNNGLTANRGTLHVEFDAAETIRYFNTEWWKDFRKSVGIRIGRNKAEEDFAKKFLTNKRAVVIGLLNLDCVHKCYTELHPVYALAINIRTELRNDGSIDDVWAIFARNWGNEGWCSKDQHYLNLENSSNRLSLMLPWGPGTPEANAALSPDIVYDRTRFLSNSTQASGPELSIVGDQGIVVSFLLPKPAERARVHGELRLRWTMPKDVSKATQPTTGSSAMLDTALLEVLRVEIEEEPLNKLLGEEGREKVESENKSGKPDTVVQRVTLKRDTGPRRVFSILDRITGSQKMIIQPLPPSQPPSVKSEFDAEKAIRDRRLLGIPPP